MMTIRNLVAMRNNNNRRSQLPTTDSVMTSKSPPVAEEDSRKETSRSTRRRQVKKAAKRKNRLQLPLSTNQLTMTNSTTRPRVASGSPWTTSTSTSAEATLRT
jgi:hypothetical protein